MTSFWAYSPPVCASFHGPPWLHFEPSKLLNYVRYDFNADSDPDTNPAFHSYADPASQDNVNPDLQPWFSQRKEKIGTGIGAENYM